MNRKEIKRKAREIIKNNLWKILKPYLIIMFISIIITIIFDPTNQNERNLTIGFIINILLFPLTIGLNSFILKVIRKKEFDNKQIFTFYKKFIFVASLYILINIFVALWSLLLIIPGIIAALSYTMAPYLMADGKEDPLECIRESKKLMYGYKWDYFKFIFSFFWWILISIFAFWYVIPYLMVSEALYYEELKKITKID